MLEVSGGEIKERENRPRERKGGMEGRKGGSEG